MSLNKQQENQIQKQFQDHRHKKYEIDIELEENEIVSGFIVYPNILRPERMVALELARYLFRNKNLYKNKTVTDIGCGSGIQGIVTGLYGASRVVFSDISLDAVKNTKENILKQNLVSRTDIFQGDLFEKIKSKSDLIIFNHPFFPGKPTREEPSSIAMLDEGGLLHRFLKNAPDYLNEGGEIIMPYFNLAGDTNDPYIQGSKHGYKVEEVLRKKATSGKQIGIMTITSLTKPLLSNK